MAVSRRHAVVTKYRELESGGFHKMLSIMIDKCKSEDHGADVVKTHPSL